MKNKSKAKLIVTLMTFFMACTSILVVLINVQAAEKKVGNIILANIENNMLVLKKGDTWQLKTIIEPSNASNKELIYRTSNKKVATVSKKGKIMAKGYGSAKITIQSADKKEKRTITVKVPEIPVTKVTVSPEEKTITVGNTFLLKATIMPKDASIRNLSYKSSNQNVATVDSKGKVKGINAGCTTITVITLDGKKQTTCKVTVKQKEVKVKSVTLALKSVDLYEGETKELEIEIKPDNATNKNVIWTSSNKEVATITNGLIQAVKEGTSTITAVAADGSGNKAECVVNVKKKLEETQPSQTSESDSNSTANQGYKLVWEDDFNGTKLNTDNWNYEYHDPGWVNNELQKYTDSPDNIYVKDGDLVIKAIKTVDENGTHYTSGRINTQNKHDYKYGRFEVRAKVPSGKGFLPAFWMMPTDENLYGQWPKCGEIDVMEVLGDQTNKSFGTLHFGEPHTQSQGSCTLTNGDFASEFHTYACEWEPSEIRFYVDGKMFYKENDWFSKKTGYGEATYPAPYDQPFYLILNLAVGGSWPGNPDETTNFGDNAELCVDYVKVYQKDSYDENVQKPVKNLVFRDPDLTGNYVINGDFKELESLSDGKNWEYLQTGGGKASAEIADNAIHIKTQDAGSLNYSIQLVEAGLPMIQGYKYRLSFDAYASDNRTIITDITAPDKGYKRYFPDTTVALTADKQHYNYDFDMTDVGDINGRVEFNLGNQGSTADVHISNVRLEKIGTADIPQEIKSVLPDGNYVYNGEFEQGKDRMDYWSVDSKCEGVNASVTNIDNKRELKITMPNTVTSLDQVIVKQDPIAISGNKTYTLSFDAYADGNKSIQSVIDGQSFDTQLTNIKTTYKYKFNTEAGLNGSTLKFLLGQEGSIYIDNVRIQEDSLLINGDFANGMTGFEVYAYNPSDVSYVVDELHENKAACIDINNTGDADWKIQLKQNNITLENGKWYRISLDAKSTKNRKIMYALQKDGSADNDWTPYSGTQVIDLTNDYKTFTCDFQMNGQTDKKTILSISTGAVGGVQITDKHTVILDNISLVEIAAPKKEDIPSGTELIKNGNFATQNDGWVNAVTAPGDATADFTQGKAIYNISNVGTDDWNIQLKQDDLTLEKGASYEVKFKIKSSAPRTVKYALLNPNDGYKWYGGSDILLENDVLKVIDETIVVTENNANTISFVISMGKIKDIDTPTSIIEISDISIVKK
ncbi:carbohydrate binding domain-containing protein [Anaeromicropila herbilytica]|uniref:GH16 domain-containing protein n=1 Tax=Anaeromicropila herbilytica TaxID=2785025 RepID=A0A7R7EIW5_9FIRM|nr:carbohydrate binding domain-containing protein [Anaeromicropila herbilytica]BCN29267.1 hypothetical protein bsdtb5_05620 [Anaeromicropila herbilytica]